MQYLLFGIHLNQEVFFQPESPRGHQKILVAIYLSQEMKLKDKRRCSSHKHLWMFNGRSRPSRKCNPPGPSHSRIFPFSALPEVLAWLWGPETSAPRPHAKGTGCGASQWAKVEEFCLRGLVCPRLRDPIWPLLAALAQEQPQDLQVHMPAP